MKILATDLDRTLLPNGSWEASSGAVRLFNDLTEKHDILVVYVTGRNLELTEKAIEEYGVRYPHVLCGDVGTTISRYENGSWLPDRGWIEHIKKASPRWNVPAIRELISGVEGIVEQEAENQKQFKLSYYAEHKKKDIILSKINELVKGKFDEVIVYSFDSLDNTGLIDFLPDTATKQTSLEYLARDFNVRKSDVVFCGDSGNDIFPLTAGFLGVLVKNADVQLVDSVKREMKKNPHLKVYFAKGNFKGLNGNYTSGVIEGAYHYGLFDDDSFA